MYDRFAPNIIGLKSYGKVVCVFSLVPVFGMFMLCTKMLGLAPMIGFHHYDIFPETDWSEFFLNTKVTLVFLLLHGM